MVLEFKQIKVARGVPKGALGFLKGTLAYPEDDLGMPERFQRVAQGCTGAAEDLLECT